MPISSLLQVWYRQNRRDLPWRNTTDPYLIWLSEIILQQTRVAQGLDYYLRFAGTYPTVRQLAEASEDDVLKLWQGLGYYSRARNLLKAARICQERGAFPSTYAELIGLPGIGPYTAAAIASFSSGEAVATVDGNVYRVLSRLFDLDTPIDTPAGQKEFGRLAQDLLDPQHPGQHNQAMMEFGALHCTPLSPKCDDCPLQAKCLAHANGTQMERPVKAGKVKVRERHLHYYIFKKEKTLWVHQRGAGDIWQGLWEFFLTDRAIDQTPAAFSLRHQLTHQTLWCDFRIVSLPAELPDWVAQELANYQPITWEEWQKKAVPKVISVANEHISPLFE